MEITQAPPLKRRTTCPQCFFPLWKLLPEGSKLFGTYLYRTQQYRFKEFIKRGLVVVDVTHPRLVTLDLDANYITTTMHDAVLRDPSQPPCHYPTDPFPAHKFLMEESEHPLGITSWYMTTSKNGGWHVYLVLRKPIHLRLKASYASWLGSDPMREALSETRRQAGTAHPWVLLELPDQFELLTARLTSIGELPLIQRVTDTECELIASKHVPN